MSAFVYMLRCKDGSLYTGWTNDLQHRLAAHNAGKGAKYTRGRGPVTMVYAEALPDKESALKRECAVKKLTRREKLALCAGWDEEKFNSKLTEEPSAE
ncbi:GIY-YIG nuclease family protein [Phascolarctobacterium sp.]|uniref:GIY-YIG nuclease family protein n=1 Tax=Phascolarctobacterium sp. TaxID=2049039 RepID=UPI00386ECE36